MRRISTGLHLPSDATGKYSLLCCANLYGMLFIGGNNSFAMCYTATLHTVNSENTRDRNEAGMMNILRSQLSTCKARIFLLAINYRELESLYLPSDCINSMYKFMQNLIKHYIYSNFSESMKIFKIFFLTVLYACMYVYHIV